MFIKCKMVQDSWNMLCNSLSKIGISNIRPSIKLLVMGYKVIHTEYIELNEVLVCFTFGIFKSYCLSDGWKTKVKVLDVVKRELKARNSYYTNRKLCILKKLCDQLEAHHAERRTHRCERR